MVIELLWTDHCWTVLCDPYVRIFLRVIYKVYSYIFIAKHFYISRKLTDSIKSWFSSYLKYDCDVTGVAYMCVYICKMSVCICVFICVKWVCVCICMFFQKSKHHLLSCNIHILVNLVILSVGETTWQGCLEVGVTSCKINLTSTY